MEVINVKKKSIKHKKPHFRFRLKKITKAFTTVELLIVIALITIIGATSIPFLSRYLTQNNTNDTYNRLLAEFRKAQTYSMSGKQNGPWGVYYGTVGLTKKVILYQGTSYATHNAAYDEIYTVSPNVTVSGFSDINFAQVSGKPNTSATITITGTSNTARSIQINDQGIVNYAAAGPTYTPGAPTATLTPTATPTSAPITLDVVSSSSTTSWSHTTANKPNRIILVGIGDGGGTTGVSYGGQALTKIGQLCAGSGECISLWYRINPLTGTNTVSINGGGLWGSGASTYYNVSQTTPLGNYSQALNNSVTVTTTSTTQIVVDNALVNAAFASITPGAGQTRTWNNSGGLGIPVGGSYKSAGATSTTMSWSGVGGEWNLQAVALNQAP